MKVYPTRIVTDSMGNQKKAPDLDNPVEVWVNVSTDRQSTAELVGQVDVEVLKVHTRTVPTGDGSWAQIELRDKIWDLAKPPTWTYLTKALTHVELTLRSRNQNVPSG